MMKLINRIGIVIDALLMNLKKNKAYTPDKNILIVFQQVFGDSVVLQSSLKAYTDLYPKKDGYRIKLLVRPSVFSFMRKTMVLPNDIEYEEVDFRKFLENYKYYKSIVDKYRNFASTLIVPGTSLSAEIFATANNAARRIGLVRSIDVTRPYIYALFYKLAYTERVKPDKEDMMLQRHRLLLRYLGEDNYKARLAEPIKQNRVITEGHYVVMCPGSSVMEKCWPIDRFAIVADYIIEKYGLDIHLCGGFEEKHFEKELLGLAKCVDRIHSHIGETTFEEWSSIVEYADLVIGNDSATMHLAVAHRRKAICIVGVYDKYQFFPYKVDELDIDDCLPLTVMKDMPCEYCRTFGYNAGYGNKKCTGRIKNNQCALCIEMITVNEVIEKIDRLLEGDTDEIVE